MSRVHHIGLWTSDLESMRVFYTDVLGGESGPLYRNAATGFRSYFIAFEGGIHVELMSRGGSDTPAARTDRSGRE